MKNFDIFVGIDWSGAKAPVRTSAISVALCQKGEAAPELVPGPFDGKWSRDAVADWIARFCKKNQRVFIGIDCNFGYAEETGIKQFGPDYDYRDLWAAVEEASKNAPNYFAGGFWQHPDYAPSFWTTGKMREGFSMPKRLTETICGESGYGWPESPFKLIGAKQVGKGGLAGMRMVYDLKKKLGDKLCIWPFEENANEAAIVMSEIYPRQFLRRTGHGNAKLHDVRELNICLEAFGSQALKNTDISDHDGDSLISAAGLRYLCGHDINVPERIANPPMLNRRLAKQEGWIFGVGDRD